MFVQEFADILRSDNTVVKIARACLAWRLESVKGGSQAYCKRTSVPFPARNRHLLLFLVSRPMRFSLKTCHVSWILAPGCDRFTPRVKGGSFRVHKKDEISTFWQQWAHQSKPCTNDCCGRNAIGVWRGRAEITGDNQVPTTQLNIGAWGEKVGKLQSLWWLRGGWGIPMSQTAFPHQGKLPEATGELCFIGHGGDELMVGLGDLRGLLQP